MSISKRVWKNAGKRKGARKGKAYQVYLCHNGYRFRKQYGTPKEAGVVHAEVFLKMVNRTFKKEFYSATVEDVVVCMLKELKVDYYMDFLPGSTFRLVAGTTVNYVIGDRDRYDVNGKRHINDKMLAWSREKGIGHMKLCDVTPPVVTKFIRSLQLSGANHELRSRALSAVRRIFDYAIMSLGWATANPADGIEVKKTKNEMRGKIKMPQKPHIALLMKVGNPYQQLLVQYCSSTAMRIGEVMASTWDDTDLKNNKITVNATIDGDNRRVPPKSEAGLRPVDIADELAALLQVHFLDLKVKNDGIEPLGTDFVFSNGKTHYSHTTFYRKVVMPLFKAAAAYQIANPDEFPALPPLMKWKDFRHFAISMWLELQLDYVTVMTMAGHASMRTIERTYAHVIESQSKKDKLNKAYQEVFG